MFLNRPPLNPREWAQHGVRVASQPMGTHTHTFTACPHAYLHTQSAHGHTGVHTRIPGCPAGLYTHVHLDCAHTHMCTHSSHLHKHTHMHTLLPTQMCIHKCPTHTCLSTHTCAIALTIWTDAKLFYLYTHMLTHVQPPPVLPTPTCKLFYLYACTHLCMPNCPAKPHTHKTILLAPTHTHATFLPARELMHMHTHSLHTVCFPPVPFSHQRVCVCMSV